MPPDPEITLPDFNDLRRGRFEYFPVVPGRVEFAWELRRKILDERPQIGRAHV